VVSLLPSPAVLLSAQGTTLDPAPPAVSATLGPAPPAVSATLGPAPPAVSLRPLDDSLQTLLDEIYFLNDLLNSSQPALAAKLVSCLLAGFVLPMLVQPLVPTVQLGTPPAGISSSPHAGIASSDLGPTAQLGSPYGISRAEVSPSGISRAEGSPSGISRYRREGELGASPSGISGPSSPSRYRREGGLGASPSGISNESRYRREGELLSLWSLGACLCTLSHAPLLNALATLLLHPMLKLDAVDTPVAGPCALPLCDATGGTDIGMYIYIYRWLDIYRYIDRSMEK